MTKKMTNIIVGCGGSGAKTATELAELMGQDPQWRHEMDQNVFFMLIDTDQNDLDRYSRLLRGSAPDVHVSSILSTAGFNTVGEILAEFIPGLMNGTDAEKRIAMERFSEHWWFENQGDLDFNSANPFRAPLVAQIKTGAGQVPLVSHLAAWHAMRDNARTPNSIESTLINLCDVIAARRAIIDHGGSDPLAHFNIFFLGSVAGGTGRGCMIPVAFKFKEVLFNRFKSVPFISGYFLDESCFKEGRDMNEELPQRINAMTGWSELSSWISYYLANANRGYRSDDYAYSLPSTSGTADASYDVLRSPLQGKHAANENIQAQDKLRRDRARLPFDAVAVIGNASSSGFAIRDPKAIYQMVATGLYCRLTRSEIESKISNEGRTYFSIGSAVAEIPCHDIQTYYSDLARYDVARLLMRDPWENEARSEAAGILDWLGLGMPLPTLLADPVEGEVETSTELLVREWFSPQGAGDLELNKLQAALDDQSLSEVQHTLDEMLNECRLEDPLFLDEIGRAFINHFSAYQRAKGLEIADGDSLAGLVEELLIGAESPGRRTSVLDRTGSAAVVAETARWLDIMLADLGENTLSQKAIDEWFSDPMCPQRSPDVGTVLEETKGREGPFGIMGKRFNDQEIMRLTNEARRALQVLYARALGRWLGSSGGGGAEPGLLGRLRPKLARIHKNASMVVKCADRCLTESGLTADKLRTQASKLFAPENLVDSLAMSDPNSTSYYVRRNIRPPQPAMHDLELVNPATLESARSALMLPPMEGTAEDQPVLRNRLRESFSASKYLFKGQHRGEEIISRFELSRVLRDLRKLWIPYLEKVKNRGKDAYEETAQKFRNFFGINPRVIGDTVSISSDGNFDSIAGEDSLLLGMACSMARACRPFWRTSDSAARQPKLLVQIPIEPVEEMISDWETTIQNQANIEGSTGSAVEVIANRAEAKTGNRHNPFVLVVYMSEGASTLDRVESLDVWQIDSKLHKALQRAEDLRRPMAFAADGEMWDGYRGSGFADPCYVFNPLLRKHRWRPWIPRNQQEQERAEISELDLAVVYACWGPAWFLKAALGEEGCARALSASKMPGEPLFVEGERRIFAYARVPRIIQSSGVANLNTGRMVFGPGDSVAQSIRTIPDVLEGRMQPRSKAENSGSHIRALREAVEQEYEGFFGPLAREYGFHPESGRAVYAKLVDAMEARALVERDRDRSDSEFWQRVLDALVAKRRLYQL